jgi:hypothetical protein
MDEDSQLTQCITWYGIWARRLFCRTRWHYRRFGIHRYCLGEYKTRNSTNDEIRDQQIRVTSIDSASLCKPPAPSPSAHSLNNLAQPGHASAPLSPLQLAPAASPFCVTASGPSCALELRLERPLSPSTVSNTRSLAVRVLCLLLSLIASLFCVVIFSCSF